MNWTTETRGTRTHLVASERGTEVARVVAAPKIGKRGAGIVGWTILRLEVAEGRRDDADFQRALIPELIGEVKKLGWVTDEDIAAYRLVRDDEGRVRRIEAGTLTVRYPDDPTQIMGFRANARLEAERLAGDGELEEIADDVAVVLGRPPVVRPPAEDAPVDPDAGGIGGHRPGVTRRG